MRRTLVAISVQLLLSGSAMASPPEKPPPDKPKPAPVLLYCTGYDTKGQAAAHSISINGENSNVDRWSGTASSDDLKYYLTQKDIMSNLIPEAQVTIIINRISGTYEERFSKGYALIDSGRCEVAKPKF